ncbi:MAG: hypothetical protein ACP5GJ_04025 [Nanopusillaceae archaeon]
MRRILYLLLFLLPEVSFIYNVYSLQPVWPTFSKSGYISGSASIPLYLSQLVYAFNLPDGFNSSNIQIITFTVPEQVLQQQLYYCKTYDPYITSINLSQCVFAYPIIAVLYSSPAIDIYNNPNAYNIVYSKGQIIPIDYDNTTGLPNTFAIFLGTNYESPLFYNLNNSFYLYVYYPGPSFYSIYSLTSSNISSCPFNLTNVSSYDFNGGWCGGMYTSYYFFEYYYPWGVSLSGGYDGNFILTRYLYVKFNPSYPVMIGYLLFYLFYALDSSGYDQGSVTVMNPSTGQTKTITFSGGPLYDLRLLELQNGLDPNQWNEIVNISISGSIHTSVVHIYGFSLIYVPQT